MAERSTLLRIRADVGDAVSKVDRLSGSLKGVGASAEVGATKAKGALAGIAQSVRNNEQAYRDAGAALTAFGAVTAGALIGSAKAAIDWESAFAGVTKTVDDSAAGYAALSDELRGMARELPASAGEIAGVAEAAGQLGVAREDITSFTRTMVDLGETTNLTADEAATSIAQMANVMGTSGEDVERLGSTLVALGNDGASTEKQIIEMSQRISGAAAIVGLSEADVLAFANTVASMGIEVEAGGTSVSRVLTDMSKAAQTGGDDLAVFAETAGMSASEFATAFEEDPARAFAAFISGLGGVQEAGGNVFAILEDLGLSDVRVSQAILGMAASGDLLTDSLDLGAKAWADNTALADEAGKRYETTGAKIEVARNNLVDAGISIGEVILPAIATGAEAFADLAGTVADLPDPVIKVGVALTAAAAAAGLAGGAALLLAPRILATRTAFQALGVTASSARTGLGKFAGFAGGPLGIALTVATVGLGAWIAKNAEAEANVEAHTEAIKENGGALGANNRELVAAALEADGAAEAAQALGIDLSLLTDAALGNKDAQAELTGQLGGLSEQYDGVSSKLYGVGESQAAAREQIALVSGAVAGQSEAVSEANEVHARNQLMTAGTTQSQKSLEAQTARLTAQAEAYTAALGSTQEQVAASEVVLSRFGSTVGLTEDQIEEIVEAQQKWREEISGISAGFVGFNTALTNQQQASEEWATAQANATETADDSWSDFYDGQTVSVDEWIAELERMVTAQAEWETNMLLLSGRVSQGVIDELARMGPEGAPLVADLVDASDTELARLEEVMQARSEEGAGAFAVALEQSKPVIRAAAAQLGQAAADQIAAEIAAGEITVQEAIDKYDIVMDISSDTSRAVDGWSATIRDINASTGTLDIDADDKPGQDKRRGLVRDINDSAGTVDMLGNDKPGQDLRRGFLRDINASSGTVDLKGNDKPGQAARRGLVDDIDDSDGTVDILGADGLGQRALRNFIGDVNDSDGTLGIKGNTSPAQRELDAWFRRNNNRTINVYSRITSQTPVAAGGFFEGGVQRFAGGGTTQAGGYVPRQSMMGGPQFGRTNILWGEPETGWEAYISGKPGMEERNRRILAMAAERLGMTAFARGGIYDRMMPATLNMSANTDRLGDLLHDAVAKMALATGGPKMTGSYLELLRLANPFGVPITSTIRPGARTLTEVQSKHAQGKAIDTGLNKRFWDYLEAQKSRFAELYSPWGLWNKGQSRYSFPGADIVRRSHQDHIHIATYADGAIHGTGTGTSDSNFIRASRGEHMLTAREVSSVGGHDEVYRLRKAMLTGAVRYDIGGEVGVPYNRRFAQTRFAPMSQQGVARSAPQQVVYQTINYPVAEPATKSAQRAGMRMAGAGRF